jgi:hypothetical protein
MSIIELRQTSENDWKAKYEGNYGIYTIKITRKEGKTVRFSCSCPSDYSPCKHIHMIEEAIAKKADGGKKNEKNDDTRVEELLSDVSADELKRFVAAQAKYNPELRNAIFLEFAAKTKTESGNKYQSIIRQILESASVPGEDYYSGDYYSEEATTIDELDEWLDKAENCASQKQYTEAILICKAIIEEFSLWIYENKFDEGQYFSYDYYSVPFEIITAAAKHGGKRELFDYCLLEIKKKI